MKSILMIFGFIFCLSSLTSAEVYIRVNQVGFLPNDIKSAVIISNESLSGKQYQIINSTTNQVVYRDKIKDNFSPYGNFNFTYRIYFSDVNLTGSYYIAVSGARSLIFRIGGSIYNNIVPELLKFFKVQRCGYTSPLMHTTCHSHDATHLIDNGGTLNYTIDVTGGWHDAGDYVKFVNTISYATYLMLFAYDFDPVKFGFDNDNNNAPDILEEAKIGLDWLLRANYRKGKLVIQVQDLQDHDQGWRMPENDKLENNRPAYVGISKNIIGMYCAALALGARIWTEKFNYLDFAAKCLVSAEEIYNLRNNVPDVDSTGSGFYFDKSYEGKLSLAAVEIYEILKKPKYLSEAKNYSKKAGADYWWSWGDISALAQYRLAKYDRFFVQYLESNLAHFIETMNKNVFGEGADFYWGSNNTLLGIALNNILYKKLTNSSKFNDLELSQRDYVLGKNPWGISFIYKFGTNFSRHFHHQIAYFNNGKLPGGFAAGAVKKSVYNDYRIEFESIDRYAKFQTENAYYRDDRMDYISNEPTISANATAMFVFGYYSN